MKLPWRKSEPACGQWKDEGARTICSCPAGDPGLEKHWEMETRQLLKMMDCEEKTLRWIGWQAHDGTILEHFRPCGTKARFAVRCKEAKRLEAMSRKQYGHGRRSGTTYQEKPIGGCQCQCRAMLRLIYPDGRVYPIRVEREYRR